MVSDKIIIMKDDLLIIKNVTQTILRRCIEFMKIIRFDWLEPIAGLFYLQINLLIMIFGKFWKKPRNVASLDQYARVLKQPKVSKNMENFHTYNMFFKHIINAYAIILVIKKMVTNVLMISKAELSDWIDLALLNGPKSRT